MLIGSRLFHGPHKGQHELQCENEKRPHSVRAYPPAAANWAMHFTLDEVQPLNSVKGFGVWTCNHAHY